MINNKNLAVHCKRSRNVYDKSLINISEEEWRDHLNDGNLYKFEHVSFEDKENAETIFSTAIGWITYIMYRLAGKRSISKVTNTYYFDDLPKLSNRR